MFEPDEYLDFSQFPYPEFFNQCNRVWDALTKTKALLSANLKPAIQGQIIGQPYIADDVMIGVGTVIEHGAVILGPTIIGENCQIRSSAYIRGNVITGDNCVLGNASEFKNAILFNGVQVPHFSYVGDAVLGYKAHLGAGVILSNFKSIKGNVTVVQGNEKIDTGLRKFSAVLGDESDIGCNCVLNPGSLIGRRVIMYPNVSWRGTCPSDKIVKLRQEHVLIERRSGS